MAKDGDLRKAPQHAAHRDRPAGKPQMISAGAKAAYGYYPRTGRESGGWIIPTTPVARCALPGWLAFIVTGNSREENVGG